MKHKWPKLLALVCALALALTMVSVPAFADSDIEFYAFEGVGLTGKELESYWDEAASKRYYLLPMSSKEGSPAEAVMTFAVDHFNFDTEEYEFYDWPDCTLAVSGKDAGLFDVQYAGSVFTLPAQGLPVTVRLKDPASVPAGTYSVIFELVDADPNFSAHTAWLSVRADLTVAPAVPEQTIVARWEEERGHRYAYDTNGKQILGDGNDSVVVTADGDIYANKNIYYLNPERDAANPDTCYLVTNYIRVRPNDGGLTFYDADGISFYGWMHAEGGGMRFQTRLENIPGVDPYCIFVWHAQYLPSVQHPDHPGDPAYFLPAGWYLFDDDGIRITADGEYDYKYDVDQQMHHYTVKDGMIVAIDGVAVA